MKHTFKKIAYILVTLSFFTVSAFAADANAIMKKVHSQPEAKSMKSEAIMELKSKSGHVNKRRLLMCTRKTSQGTDSYIEFMYPADVKGTKFLTIGNDNGDDDQRLKLAAQSKPRKIGSSDKGAKFMGSDISYYDMESKSYNDYTYKYIGEGSVKYNKDGKVASRKCWIIESYPKDSESPYYKSKSWVSQDDYFVYKTEAYDKDRKNLLKTIYITASQTIKGIIVPRKTIVIVAEDGHRTELKTGNIQVNASISSSIFTIQNLMK